MAVKAYLLGKTKWHEIGNTGVFTTNDIFSDENEDIFPQFTESGLITMGATPLPEEECKWCVLDKEKWVQVVDGKCVHCGREITPKPEDEIDELIENQQHIWVEITNKEGNEINPIALSSFLSKTNAAINKLNKEAKHEA